MSFSGAAGLLAVFKPSPATLQLQWNKEVVLFILQTVNFPFALLNKL